MLEPAIRVGEHLTRAKSWIADVEKEVDSLGVPPYANSLRGNPSSPSEHAKLGGTPVVQYPVSDYLHVSSRWILVVEIADNQLATGGERPLQPRQKSAKQPVIK